MTILNRSEVDKNLTWDTSAIFKSKEEARKEANDILNASLKLKEEYEGKLTDFDTIVKAFKEYEKIVERFSLVVDYAYLNKDVDLTNSVELAFFNELLNMYNKLDENTLFVELEIAKLDIPMLEKLEKVDGLKVYFHSVILKKKTYLSDAEEKVIQAFTPLTMAPEQLYNTIKLQDLTFEPFEVNGKKYSNSYALFEEKYEYDEDKDLRRESFKHFYNDLSKTINSTAMAFNLNMQTDKIISKLRGYESVTDYLLAKQEVPRDIYENHLDTIMKELSPVMRKFARVLKDGLGLEKINYYDLKANIDPEFDPEITLDGAKEYIYNALNVLGDEYLEQIKKVLEGKNIDYVENKGKYTGAYCSTPAGFPSYILMIWTGKMDSVFTMIHELGHAGNFMLSQKYQSYFDSDPSMFYCESPSTMNEMMLANYLMKKTEDPRMLRWIYFSIIAKTYYHNFVTHFLEAYFQRKAYNLVDEGQNLDADTLNRLYKETLEEFWQGEVELTDGCEMTWMRQPHYYSGLYSYTYSAGLSIATNVSKKILEGDKEAVKDWLVALRQGGLYNPIDWAKLSGVDITTTASLKNTIAYISSIVDKIEELSKNL
ncbi:oligoendopeptidase F [Fenollaria sporofastidiosus]|uniref:oligoendopeptidase F n=1 Tax=Fenollaria sporofastidiosus TaxID=2811778 RepID=UPI001C004F9E|nr:oligoendopeptidase F [Fenollaria sporofastidiosus]